MDGATRLLAEGVMGMWSGLADWFGRGDVDALSVPPMDGRLKPNNRLDAAEQVLRLPAIDNLAVIDGRLICSSGNTLYRIHPAERDAVPIRSFDGRITAVAASMGGTLAVGVEGCGLEIGAGETWQSRDLATANGCITAALFRSENELLVTVGSRKHSWTDWKRDLMSHGATGAVLSVDVAGGEASVLREAMAFPYGIEVASDGDLIVSESWKHRLVRVSSAGASRSALDELPAYPARLGRAAGGGFWLALFAPRRQLTELILREDDYRTEMMATIPPESWIGPDFSDRADGDQPLQSGSVRQMGIMKPWAPSRSYGLVVRLDEQLRPVDSAHSRADGAMHGIASVVELDGHVYVAARGADTLLRLPVEDAS
jgi:hypothetical protein